MKVSGNLPHVHVEEEPKSRTPYNNMNKYQQTDADDEENEADSAATKRMTTAMPTTTNAEREDDADSTATTQHQRQLPQYQDQNGRITS